MMSQHASVQQLNITKELIMPVYATQETIAGQPTIGNLFLPVPDTEACLRAENPAIQREGPEPVGWLGCLHSEG